MDILAKNRAAVKTCARLVVENDDYTTLIGRVMADRMGDLVLLNYNDRCMFDGAMTEREKACRGLIVNKTTGEIVAWPLAKFYNLGEAVPSATARLVEVSEKIDGSLGILYRHNGEYKIATRGSFTSKQAAWATDFLHKKHDLRGLDGKLTLLFEIVYPQNRVVVDYQAKEALILLAARDRQDGHELRRSAVRELATQFGFETPRLYNFASAKDAEIVAHGLIDAEGFVLLYDDGSRFKVKSDDYRIKHRLFSGFGFQHVLETIAADAFDDMLPTLDDERLAQTKAWAKDIVNEELAIEQRIFEFYEQNKQKSRKDFALAARAELGDQAMLAFLALDGRDVRSAILQRFVKNGVARWR